jgi:hypothetical protein
MVERTLEEAETECRTLRGVRARLEQRVAHLERLILKVESAGAIGGIGLKVCPWCKAQRGNTGMAAGGLHEETCEAFSPDGYVRP